MANPWLDRRVLAFAHRGGALEAPANTMAAMRAAVAAGVDALELDVHLDADGELVVCHDPVVESTTDGRGRISGFHSSDLARLDAAWWFVPGEGTRPGLPASSYPLRGRAGDDPDYRIPTLESVITEFPGLLLNIDMKAPGTHEPLARLLTERGRGDDTMVASFSSRRLAAFRRLAPGISTSASAFDSYRFGLTRTTSGKAAALQLPARRAGRQVVTPALTAAAHRRGVAVHVWTVDDEETMEAMLDAGVDGIMSDRPSLLVEVLRRRGLRR